MIEINLLPKPEPPDPAFQSVLNPVFVYLTKVSYERMEKARTEKDFQQWATVWASLFVLRRELLGLGYSPADRIAARVLQGDFSVIT